jgi:hypothetical protein
MISRMSKKITLKLRDLNKDETIFREFDDEAATIAYLKDRPRLLDVLGVVFEGLTPEQNARLKAAMRPLDAEEKAAEARLDEAAEKALEAQRVIRAKEDEVARAAHIEELKNADPHRTMEVRYRYNGDIELVDGDDPRSISDEARQAITAWIAERNEWVESRGQMVGEAKITCWPGNLPKPGADRVQSGTFIPVSAPPKKS